MKNRTLDGQTALVTGASRRIGRAISLALADEGVNIVVHYNRSAGDAEQLCRELKTIGIKCLAVHADLSKSDDLGDLIQKALELTGSLDILVNNASVFAESKIDTVTFDEFVEAMRINAWAPFALGREFAHRLKKGKIVNLIDTRHLDFDWSHVAYILSKKMLAEMTRMMAVHFAPDTAVNAVAPGLILPPEGKDEEYLQKLAHTVPLNRHGEAEDVAQAVVFLLKSDFMTGEVVYVDGGRHLKGYRHG